MQIGSLDICIASDGYFKLDGGAMFGIVPKPLWSKKDPADERNRILLSLNPMVVRTHRKIYLIETGIGDKWDEKKKDIFAIDRNQNLFSSLQNMGISRDDVDGVILTHLHFDHAGGSITKDENGKMVPAFPKAVYYIQRGEWEFAEQPNERTRASYLPENFLPLRDYSVVEFLKGNETIERGIRVEVTGGHTPNHQVVLLESEGHTVCYLGDLIPTSSHLHLPYIMGYDTNPLDTLGAKKKLLDRAIEEHWLVVFPHSPRLSAGYVKEGDKLEPVDIRNA